MRGLASFFWGVVFFCAASAQTPMVPNGPLSLPQNPSMTFWGDSLTQGFGSSNVPVTAYPYVVAHSYNPVRPFQNNGVPGDTSTQILALFQAAPSTWGNTTGFWVGRNDFNSPTTVLNNIASMTASLSTPRYYVLSIINGDFATEYIGQTQYNTMAALNATLASIYGSHYIDIRSLLVAAYNPANGVDVVNHANGVPPFTLRGVDISGTVIGALGTSDTTFTTSVAVTHGYTLLVDSEYIYINTATGTSVTSATRGYGSSTPATHSAGAAFAGTDPLHLNDAGYVFVANAVTNRLNSGQINFLLKRDLEPASNDNSPMWLEKAA